jgi:hypothetical protein
LLLAGQSRGAAFIMLWLTHTNLNHHFCAHAGHAAAMHALFLVSAPALLREVTRGRRTGVALPLAVVGSFVVAFALALHGPNLWAYTWGPGMPHPAVPPAVSKLELGNPFLWAALAAGAVYAVHRLRRRWGAEGPSWPLAVPLVVLLFLLTSVGHLVGSFGYATLRTLDGYSLRRVRRPKATTTAPSCATVAGTRRARRRSSRAPVRPGTSGAACPAPARRTAPACWRPGGTPSRPSPTTCRSR